LRGGTGENLINMKTILASAALAMTAATDALAEKI
jgi:hypothetical protein